jgi:hypothetical protein
MMLKITNLVENCEEGQFLDKRRSNSRKSLISMIIPDNSTSFLSRSGRSSQTESNQSNRVKAQSTQKEIMIMITL